MKPTVDDVVAAHGLVEQVQALRAIPAAMPVADFPSASLVLGASPVEQARSVLSYAAAASSAYQQCMADRHRAWAFIRADAGIGGPMIFEGAR